MNMYHCRSCDLIFRLPEDDGCPRCGSEYIEAVDIRDDVVDHVRAGRIPDNYTSDDYENDSDIINNMYDVIVNGR